MELVIGAVLLGWISMSIIVAALCVAAARGDEALRAIHDPAVRLRPRSIAHRGRRRPGARRGVHL